MYIEITSGGLSGSSVKNINIKRFKRPVGIYMDKIPFRVEPKEGIIIEIGSYS